MKKEAQLHLHLNGEKYVATRYNTSLYTFYGRVILRDFELDASTFNHVFLEVGESKNNYLGAFLFSDHPAYLKVANFIFKHEFPCSLDQIHIPESDVMAWEGQTFQDLNKTTILPQEWQ